jgi:hypothetical protein
MRTKTVTRYYCEHCSKGMLRKDAMARHERVCYRNPDRGCISCQRDPLHAIPSERFEVVKRGLVDCKPLNNECPRCFMALCLRHNVTKGPQFLYYPLEQFKQDAADFENERRHERTGEFMKKGLL